MTVHIRLALPDEVYVAYLNRARTNGFHEVAPFLEAKISQPFTRIKRGRPRKIDALQMARITELKQLGYSFAEIAARLGYTPSGIHKAWHRKLEEERSA